MAPISLLLFLSIFYKYFKTKKKILHKVYMHKVHEPTKRVKTIMSTLKPWKLPRLLKS